MTGYRFNSNKLNGKTQIHCAGANSGSITIAGNSSQSNIALLGEVLSGATIRRVVWGTDTNWTITRGSNVVMVLTQAGDIDLAGLAVQLDAAGTLSINTSSANGFLMIELNKVLTTWSPLNANAIASGNY